MKLIIDIKVTDLERAIKFYTEVLELNLRIKEEDWAGIEIGDAEIHLYLNGGVKSDVEFYVDNLDEKVTKLKENNVKIVSGINKPSAVKIDGNNVTEFPWGRTAFFKDSEGNELALVKDF